MKRKKKPKSVTTDTSKEWLKLMAESLKKDCSQKVNLC